ncbi:MAG: rod shape-determining protein MreC [Verrucomicrobia bacterium]|nr:rod shape-determining protein MreC [Verrucomicrobiota bacterium]
MKPLNLLALLLFIGGVVWALTRSERSVRAIQQAYLSVMSPFIRSGAGTDSAARLFLRETRHSRELETELAFLRPELGRLGFYEQRCRELEQENAQLREALDFKKNSKFEVIAARVTRRYPSPHSQTVEIDAGTRRGVRPQMPVLSSEGLVGRIESVAPDGEHASVLLLSDEKCQVPAWVQGSSEEGILTGQRGFSGDPMLRLRFLTTQAAVRPGQRVYTSGRGGVFPADVSLGEIQSVEKGALDSEALVRPSVNFPDLGAVFVVLSAAQSPK